MLDEPLGALDRAWRARLLGEIRAILDRHALSAVYVTHDQQEAFAIGARIAVMREGRIVPTRGPRASWGSGPLSTGSCATACSTRRGAGSRRAPAQRRAP
jgi:ABC-type sulfate/molybdate transport systems ATPase subunit